MKVINPFNFSHNNQGRWGKDTENFIVFVNSFIIISRKDTCLEKVNKKRK